MEFSHPEAYLGSQSPEHMFSVRALSLTSEADSAPNPEPHSRLQHRAGPQGRVAQSFLV